MVKSTSKIKRSWNTFYRTVVWFFVILYNLQHLLRVIEVRHSTDRVVDTLFILLTTVNSLGKQVAFNVRVARIDAIIAAINGPLFTPSNKYHDDVLRRNAVSMQRLLRLYLYAAFTCAFSWMIFPIVNRTLGGNVHFTGYFPFDTSQTPTFELTLAYMSILITLQAFGNVTMDCTIVAFYAQAKVQLQMLRYNLEHLVDLKNEDEENDDDQHEIKMYKDESCAKFHHLLYSRFVMCIKHHREIIWFVDEVQSIFGEAMAIQFLVMAWVICMTVYKIVGLSILSAEFFSMVMYLGCMLGQLFIYCYYGTQLQFESEFVNQSIYESEWISLSPGTRNQLLIIMARCSRPISPCIAYIVPMSIDTYISILRFSYTLFTFLDPK